MSSEPNPYALKTLTIRRRPGSTGTVATSHNTEVLLDGEVLAGAYSLSLDLRVGSPNRVKLEMAVAEVDFEHDGLVALGSESPVAPEQQIPTEAEYVAFTAFQSRLVQGRPELTTLPFDALPTIFAALHFYYARQGTLMSSTNELASLARQITPERYQQLLLAHNPKMLDWLQASR